MRSALSFIALAAAGALAQSDTVFKVSIHAPSVLAHPNCILAHLC